MTTKRATKTPGATETTPEQTPAVDQPTIVLDEPPTQDAGTSDVGSTETTALPDMPTPGEMWETIQLLKQQLAAQQPQVKVVAQHVPTSEASASNTGRWVLTDKGLAVKEIV